MSGGGAGDKGGKELLLSRLLEGVKGCQSRFGSRSELATEQDTSVRNVCQAFEDVFLHGLKSSQPQDKAKGLWQITENFVGSGLRGSPTPVSFWPLIKSQLSKHECERFLLLQNVRSDFGRCRAWLRASLNEHSLERYILILLSLEERLALYYEAWAFLRDPELSSILPQTAAGLGSVLFALVLDNPILDHPTPHMDKNIGEADIARPVVELGQVADQFLSSSSSQRLKGEKTDDQQSTSTGGDKNLENHTHHHPHQVKKKKKKAAVNVVSFDDDGDQGTPSPSPSSPSPSTLNNAKVKPSKKIVDLSSPLREQEEGHSSSSSSRVRQEATPPVARQAATPVQIIPSLSNINSLKNDLYERSPGGGSQTQNAPEISIYSSSVKSADCISVNSVYSDCSERLDLDNLSLSGIEISQSQRLKPVRDRSVGRSGSGSGGFINGGGGGESEDPDSGSQDLIPVPNFDASVAPELLDLEINFERDDGNFLSPVTPSEATLTPSVSSLSTLERSKKKKNNVREEEEVEGEAEEEGRRTRGMKGLEGGGGSEDAERIQRLKVILDREIEGGETLRAELAEEKRRSRDEIKIFEARVDALSKENEVLKHQLNKYIGAVQLLKKEGGGARRISSFDDDGVDQAILHASVEQLQHESCDNEAAEYERKLIQVAEMHGELMEFNAHLQKALRKRDLIIGRLKEELVDLRGPLAAPILSADEEDYESWDIVDSSSNDSGSRGGGVAERRINIRRIGGGGGANERVLINIWIPSAFLTGATNDLHHVYQVFVRIKDTEWNVYRRYSQFYSLHRDLKKKDLVIGSFYFPPKKHLGNKDGKFVDERRRKLQEYLRKVMNHTLQTNSILAAHPDKNLLISIFPFFGESSFVSKTGQSRSGGEGRTSRRNLFFLSSSSSNVAQSERQSSSSSSGFQTNSSQYPQYTGL